MKRVARQPRAVPSWVALCAAGAVVSLPASARAAEGGLRIFPDPDTLLILIVLFLLLVFPLQALLFRPLLRVLDERIERIEGSRRRAEELAREAKALAERHGETMQRVRGEVEAERRSLLERAKQEAQQQLSQARAEAEAEIGRARDEIRAAVERARQGLRAEAEALGRLVAERLLGRNLS